MDEFELTKAKTITYVDITIDENLTWKLHFKTLCTSFEFMYFMLELKLYGLPKQNLIKRHFFYKKTHPRFKEKKVLQPGF